ncbi:HNH endonuclease signature motif containing protein [Nocardioides terrigena]|uniref:HNH endonuclease signature motif containing protein n=1 Tax=Nocardioides terrigena TaxID=424797 RepID=UPI000D30AAB1|nr:HNH endonuclease signature motif containing protein [Nocardioides terrigena]
MSSTTAPALPDSPAELLRAVRDQKKAADKADVEMMRLAVHWADLHIADPEFAEACFTSPKTFAGEGSPSIDEFCVPEFATMLGRTNDSAGRFLTDCVEVAYRLPRLWGAVLSGLVAGWRARIIAQTTLALTLEAATHVDEQVFWCASRLTPSQLRRVVDEARVRFMPDAVQKSLEDSADKRHVTFDTEQASFDGTMHLEANLEIPDALALAEAVASGAEHLAKLGSTDTADGRRATALGDLARHQMTIGFDDPDEDEDNAAGGEVRPQRPVKPVTQIHLYAHLSADAITHFDNPDTPDEALCGRIEQGGQRLLSVDQIRAWCGRPDVQVTVTKVIDLRERLECTGYRPTPEMREHVIVRDGTCVFPWCGRNARLCDLDHVIPYDHDHPEDGGPTATDNLAPLCRRHHRLKTRGRWRYEMTEPGVFVWTSPLGNTYLRDHTGSQPLGRAWPEPGPGNKTDLPDAHPPDL